MISQTDEERWHFTKAQADARYKRAIKEARVPPPPGVPKDYLRKKIKGEWYYFVAAYLGAYDRYSYVRDLWKKYGYKVHSKFPGEIYVRKKA